MSFQRPYGYAYVRGLLYKIQNHFLSEEAVDAVLERCPDLVLIARLGSMRYLAHKDDPGIAWAAATPEQRKAVWVTNT